MDKIKVIHELIGRTLTVWLDDRASESICRTVTSSNSGCTELSSNERFCGIAR